MKRLAVTLLISLSAAKVWALTVEEAYRAIPHRRAAYEARLSPRTQIEKDYLARLFALSDRALVERIETLQALSAGNSGRFETCRERLQGIRHELAALSEPAAAAGLSRTLSDAIDHQDKFLARWSAALKEHRQFSSAWATDADVTAASALLRQLYAELMSRFADEAPHNRDAFYQHLCALDFL